MPGADGSPGLKKLLQLLDLFVQLLACLATGPAQRKVEHVVCNDLRESYIDPESVDGSSTINCSPRDHTIKLTVGHTTSARYHGECSAAFCGSRGAKLPPRPPDRAAYRPS